MTQLPVKIYSLICSRNNNHSSTTLELFQYFKSCGVSVKNIVGFKSIFNAYKDVFDSLKCHPDDIIIMCHDDIEIKMPKHKFLHELTTNTKQDGFVGVAGAAVITKECIWWDNRFALRGQVEHGSKESPYLTYFGVYGNAVVMDGVFLACKASTLHKISMEKPASFTGDWDFYDLHFTFQAYLLGFSNTVVPIMIRHESPGNMRESWNASRLQFYELYKDNIPTSIV